MMTKEGIQVKIDLFCMTPAEYRGRDQFEHHEKTIIVQCPIGSLCLRSKVNLPCFMRASKDQFAFTLCSGLEP